MTDATLDISTEKYEALFLRSLKASAKSNAAIGLFATIGMTLTDPNRDNALLMKMIGNWYDAVQDTAEDLAVVNEFREFVENCSTNRIYII